MTMGCTRRLGFSLIEMSIVLVIFSIMTVSGLEMGALFMNRTAYNSTVDKLAVLDEAMQKYRAINLRLPCPARRGYAPNDASNMFGKEDCAYANTVGVRISAALYQGTIPIRDLNLPLSFGMDSYGGKINYLVSSGMTVQSTYNATDDAIEMRTGQLEADCDDVGDPCQVIGTAAYALFSSGSDRRGSVTVRGSAPAACIPHTGANRRIDAQNCYYLTGTDGSVAIEVGGIGSNALYDSRYNVGTNESNYFDDVIVWHSKSEL